MRKTFVNINDSEYYTLDEISKVLLISEKDIRKTLENEDNWTTKMRKGFNNYVIEDGLVFYHYNLIAELDKLIKKKLMTQYKSNFQREITDIYMALGII